jgi:hypothetical protein
VAPAQAEAETTVVVDEDGAYNLMAKAEKPKEEDLHNLEEVHILLLTKLADNAVDDEMNWTTVHCELKAHGPFVAVAAVGRRLHLKRVRGDD